MKNPFEIQEDESVIRPSPHDRAYPSVAGKSLKLAVGQEDQVSNKSQFVTDWTIKIRPAAGSIVLATPEGWGLKGALTVGYDGEASLEFQPVVNPAGGLFTLPVVGLCLGVHGRYINVRFKREGSGNGEIEILAAVVPGRPSQWATSAALPVSTGNPATFSIPIFATRFQLLTTVGVTDTIVQVAADGSTLQTVTVTASLLGPLLPIHPLAAFIRYTTTGAAKTVVCGFEVIS